MRSAALFIVLMLLASAPARVDAATLVYPHALFMDDDRRSTVFYVQNTGTTPTEIEIDLSFGYPASDSLGGVHIELIENPPPEAPSATGWVRALPRRMVIGPDQRQAIRLLAQPPQHLPAGEYWSRVIVTTREIRPAPSPEADGNILVGLRLETRTIISMSFRHADVTTRVRVDECRARVSGDDLVVDLQLEREGNAAYLGQLVLTLTDGAGTPLALWERVVAVYYDLFRSYTYTLPEIAPGTYQLQLELATVRQDIPAADVIQSQTVRKVIDLVVP